MHNFSAVEHPARIKATRFDGIVLAFMLVLVGAIVLTVLIGDRVGVQINRLAPQGTAGSTARLAIQFDEAMNWDTVTERVKIDPPIEGEFTWSGTTLRFRPTEALTPGQDYRVSLLPGAQSTAGRSVLNETAFSFTVRKPRVAYLAPADSTPQNVWIADPADPSSAEQITFSPSGVNTFAISPDGTKLAFSENNSATGVSDIKLLDLETGGLTQLTNCADAYCDTPVWRPDGSLIAYQRTERNSDLNTGVSPMRVWLIDMTTTPASTRPLFSDSQILGYSPQWSADGSRISVFDNASVGILIYNFEDGKTTLIPTRSGGSDIALSPDGTRLIYPRVIIQEGAQAKSNLQMADLVSGEIIDLTSPDEPLDDSTSAWSPDGRYLAIARRYLDERYTRTRQLYLMDMSDQSVEPLVTDERYFNGYFTFDPFGQQLLMQRFPELTESGEQNANGKPEIWTLDITSGEMLKVAENAYIPQWVP
jgi:Tol biopolymer transport system component